MKKIISIMLAVLLCFGSMSVIAFAADRDTTETKTETKTDTKADVKTGNITDKAKWSYDDSTKTLTISGTGAMSDYSKSSEAPWASYASAIKTVSVAEGITSIGKNAFNGLTALTGVSIPASVTVIGDSAFEGCLALTSATIPASVTIIAAKAFYGCTNYPTCTFISHFKPIDQYCPKCGWFLVEKFDKKNGAYKSCINPDCDYLHTSGEEAAVMPEEA